MRAMALGNRLPRAVAVILGVAFVALGGWAMVDPRSFFAALAAFEPYNQHFLQDIGAFQVGLGAPGGAFHLYGGGDERLPAGGVRYLAADGQILLCKKPMKGKQTQH